MYVCMYVCMYTCYIYNMGGGDLPDMYALVLVRLLVQIANTLYVGIVDEHCPNISPTILSLYFVYVTSYLNVTVHCG